ncbi:MAG TPA: type VI secretion system contractile sheath large subunit [Pyrinomonadaceae bacterium]
MSIFIGDENETKAALEEKSSRRIEEKPFRLLLIGNWSNGKNRSDLRERFPVEIDRDNFDDVLRNFGVELSLDWQSGKQDFVRLRFEEINDFHPDGIYRQIPLFADLRETRERLMNPQTFRRAAERLQMFENDKISSVQKEDKNRFSSSESQPSDSGDLLEQILSQTAAEPVQKQIPAAGASDLDNLISRLVKPYLVEIDETEQTKLIEALDEATGQLMRSILHHPQFKALESAWRAASLLVTKIETDSNLKIYLFDASKEELAADLKSVNDLSESGFYKLLNGKSFDSADEESYAVVCGNYAFKPDVDDVAALMRIAKTAQTSETAFIAQASSEILGIESLPGILESGDLKWDEESSARKLWAMLRALPESAHIGLTFPRFLGRMPYGTKTDPAESFAFEEITMPLDSDEYLWLNSSFACALLLAQTFASYEWEIGENFICDISDLPLYIYREAGETIIKPVTEAVIRVEAAERIIEQGLMPLITFRDSDTIRLARFQSIATPPGLLKGKWNS